VLREVEGCDLLECLGCDDEQVVAHEAQGADAASGERVVRQARQPAAHHVHVLQRLAGNICAQREARQSDIKSDIALKKASFTTRSFRSANIVNKLQHMAADVVNIVQLSISRGIQSGNRRATSMPRARGRSSNFMSTLPNQT